MLKTKSGFTIVELLIVIVVIAILAAITIVSYNGIKNRTNQVAVQSDLNTVVKKLAIYKIDNGHYPMGSDNATTRTALATIDIKLSTQSYQADIGSNLIYFVDTNVGSKYALLAKPQNGAALVVSSAQSTPSAYTGSHPFPGSSYGDIASDLGFSTETIAYNIYASGTGFRIWN